MKKPLGLTLSFAVALLGAVSAAAPPARAQEVASSGSSINKLREDYERLLAVERNPETPPEVREINQNFLSERRAQLVAALRTRINALRMYQASIAGSLAPDEKRAVEGSIGKLVEELESLQPRPAAAVRPARVAQGGAPIAITSPERDKTLHVSEVELEIAVNDDDIDDLMVAVYTPASEKPRSARVLNLKRSDRGTKSVVVALTNGENRIEVSDLKRGGVKAERLLTFERPSAPGIGSAGQSSAQNAGDRQAADETANATENVPEYDWGRVRAYFMGGVVMSKENSDFSKNDIFLDFTADKNIFASGKRKFFKDFNSFFNARMTSIPVSQPEGAAEDTDDDEEDEEPCNTPDCANFISSRKAVLLQGGFYLPIYGKHTSWLRKVPVESVSETSRDSARIERSYNYERNAIFFAPLVKGGISTITGDRLTATSEGRQFDGDDVFNFYSFGFMLGHYRVPTRRVRCESTGKNRAGRNEYEEDCYRTRDASTAYRYVRNTSLAPELISWLTFTTGRWESFNIDVPTGETDAEGDPITTRQRPWRYEVLGRMKVPSAPFIVGFDGNFGKGPDDLRFIFGMRFDIGKLFHALRVGQVMRQAPEAAPAPDAPPRNAVPAPPQ